MLQVLIALPISWMIESRGSSFAILVGSVFSMVGGLIKLFINESFWFGLVG